MKRKTAIVAICVTAMAGVMISGCATPSGGALNNPPEQKLLVQYSDPAFEEALQQAGLKSTYVEYWQSHGTRNWQRRYELEKFQRPVEEKFYVAYYGKAWVIRSMHVTDVKLTDGAASVGAAITFAHPDTLKDVVQILQDKWALVNGVWLHVVQDPMLSGFTQ